MTFLPKPKVRHPSLPKNSLGLTRRDYDAVEPGPDPIGR